jgi:plastocyanin
VTPPAPAPAPPPAAAPAPVAPEERRPLDPVRERARQLREVADLLEKAADARDRDARSYAEQLFSTAELVVGPQALAEIAPRFREGAPPRVTTPTKTVSRDAPPQPAAEGDSEKDHPEPPKPRRGAIAGVLTVDGKPFADAAVVTLQPVGRKKRVALPTARVIEQRNRQFAPRVLVVPVGSIVSFPNFDPTFHNVFSTSEARPFDLGLYKSGETREILFDKEGTVRVGCNLHANMSAFVAVVAAPHYTISDGGKFAFRSVEPGKYVLRPTASGRRRRSSRRSRSSRGGTSSRSA